MKRTHSATARLRQRNGWQLVELLAVISLTAILVATSAQLLVMLMRLETQAGFSLADSVAYTQFHRQLRSDAHDAVSLTVEPDSLSLTLTDQSVVRYESRPTAVTRERQARDFQGVRPNIYRLSAGQVKFAHDRPAGLLKVTHATPPGATVPSATQHTFEVAIGLLAPSSEGESLP